MADMRLAAVAEVFRRLRDANPHPTTELEYATPFQLLIAVILSAQATDKSVNLATRRLFADAPTPQAMVPSSDTWQATPRWFASRATARSMGSGPQA